MSKIETLKEKLDLLRNSGTAYSRFGARLHRYTLYPCLSEEYIQEFEAKHQITLPTDYRDYLLKIGGGGAGPGLGIFSLATYWGYDLYREEIEAYPSFLSSPFPHTQKWNVDLSNDEAYDDYSHPKHIQGSIMISSYGCTIDVRLVVSGSEKGNIWIDDRGADYGIHPRLTDNKHTDFYTWFNAWLDGKDT